MRIDLSIEHLLAGLETAKPVFPGNHHFLPVLEYSMLSIKDGKVSLVDTNLETAIVCRIPAAPCHITGSLLLRTRPLLDMLRVIKDGVLTVTGYENVDAVEMVCGRDRFTLYQGKNTWADFPAVPEVTGPGMNVTDIYDIAECIKPVKDTMYKNKYCDYPGLMGILFDMNKHNLVTTDKEQMTVKAMSTSNNASGLFRVYDDCINILTRIAPDACKVTYNDKLVKFETDRYTVTTLNLESNSTFPAYQDLIGKPENKTKVKVYE